MLAYGLIKEVTEVASGFAWKWLKPASFLMATWGRYLQKCTGKQASAQNPAEVMGSVTYLTLTGHTEDPENCQLIQLEPKLGLRSVWMVCYYGNCTATILLVR